MNIHQHIDSNKRKTVFIIIFFIAFISAFGFIVGEAFIGQGTGLGVLAFAFIFSSITSVVSYYTSDKMVLSIAGAKKIDREQLPQVYGILENLCVGSGLKKVPDLYLIDDTATNAFATGRDPDHAVIAVTSGLIQKLDKREVEGVLAHELSHIVNYDIRLMTIVVILVGTVTMMADILLRGSYGGNRKGSGVILLIGFILIILSPLIAQMIKLAVSRNREYLADSSASLLTRDPEGLASALEKISVDREALEVANKATAHMYIENPLRKGKNSGMFAQLFNTHPPVEERIQRLRTM